MEEEREAGKGKEGNKERAKINKGRGENNKQEKVRK